MTTTSTKPAFTAYAVAERAKGEQKKTRWREIGAAFAHKDGKGFDVVLDAFPRVWPRHLADG